VKCNANLANPQQAQQPQQPPQQHIPQSPPKGKMSGCLIALIVVGCIAAFLIFVIVIFASAVSSNSGKADTDISNSSIETEDATENIGLSQDEELSEEEAAESLKNNILNALNYHLDFADGKAEDAGTKGAWAAFQANLWAYELIGRDTFEYHVYYYAVYGKNVYIGEFGDDSEYLYDIQEYISSLITDKEIQKIDDYFQQKELQVLIDEQEYKDSAEIVDYSDLIRNPSKYESKIIKVTMSVSQELTGGVFTESGYMGKSNGNEWYAHYNIPENSPRILVGDTVIFYGEFTGLKKMTRALTGTAEYIPRIDVKYHSIIS